MKKKQPVSWVQTDKDGITRVWFPSLHSFLSAKEWKELCTKRGEERMYHERKKEGQF